MSQIRLGLIGTGDVVQRFYLPSLAERPDWRVTAVASAGGASARAVSERLAATGAPAPVVCADATALLARDDLDAVAVCTPPDSHGPIGIAALRSGRHVLMEKPIAESYAAAAALFAEATRASPILYYTYNNRLRDENVAFTRHVSSGALGPLDAIDVEWLRTKPMMAPAWWRDAARAGGGILADLGSHIIIIALGLVADRSRFRAHCGVVRRSGRPDDPEDVAAAHVEIDGRTQLTLRTGWGMALDQPAIVNLRAFGRTAMATNRDFPAGGDGYGAVLDRFAGHIRAGRQPDLGIVDDASRLLEALLESARTGRVVEGRFRGGAWS